MSVWFSTLSVSRFNPGKPKAVLIKFLSPKAKDLVMRNKRRSSKVKVRDDLAVNVKKALDNISFNPI